MGENPIFTPISANINKEEKTQFLSDFKNSNFSVTLITWTIQKCIEIFFGHLTPSRLKTEAGAIEPGKFFRLRLQPKITHGNHWYHFQRKTARSNNKIRRNNRKQRVNNESKQKEEILISEDFLFQLKSPMHAKMPRPNAPANVRTHWPTSEHVLRSRLEPELEPEP